MEVITEQDRIIGMVKRFAGGATQMVYALRFASDDGAKQIKAEAAGSLEVLKKFADRHEHGPWLVTVYEKIAGPGDHMDAHDDASMIAAIMDEK